MTSTFVAFVLNSTRRYGQEKLPVALLQGPMNNSPQLFAIVQNVISAVNAAGGNAFYVDVRGPPNDGCGGHPGVQGHAQMYEMAVAPIANATGWTWAPAAGFISDGGDVLPAANMSLAAAQALCLSTPGCRGLTYASDEASPSGDVLIYFKNHTDTSGTAGWWSQIRTDLVRRA